MNWFMFFIIISFCSLFFILINIKLNRIEETLNEVIRNQIRLDDLICEEIMYYKEMKERVKKCDEACES